MKEAKEAAKLTPEQIAAAQQRTEEHIQKRNSLISSKARAKAEEDARLQLLHQQVCLYVIEKINFLAVLSL